MVFTAFNRAGAIPTARTVGPSPRLAGMADVRARNAIRPLIVTCGVAGASMAAGYGVLFAMLDDFRDEYGISESALGAVIGVGFFAGFVSQVTIAPLSDKGHARRLVLNGTPL